MATANPMPLFYQDPQLLRFDAHKNLGVVPSADFSFAAKATAIPVSVSEFMPAVRNYPIVFVGGSDPAPIAVTGLKEGQNLMVDSNGHWEKGSYIPAYVRRYPFILIQAPDDKERRMLAFEANSKRIRPVSEVSGAVPLFDDEGKPGPGAAPALQFCEAYHQHKQQDKAFLKAIHDAGLLVERRVDFTLPSGNRFRMDGFLSVDVERYRALPAKTVKEWNQKGWLDAIALHIASEQNWNLLLDRNHRGVAAA